MGKMKTTTINRVIRIPLVIWNKYNLEEKEFEADWYDAMDEDTEHQVDGREAIIVHFRRIDKENEE
jgi:hypothetical protein